jgi:hypothetical protein
MPAITNKATKVANARVTALRNTLLNIQHIVASKPPLGGSDAIDTLAGQVARIAEELRQAGYTQTHIDAIVNSCRN